MKIILAIIFMVSCCASADELILSEYSYGQIKFGERYSDVEKYLGREVAQKLPRNTECNQIKFENYPLAYFMIENGVVTRVDVAANVKNSLHIVVGEKAELVIKRHPTLIVEKHKYDPSGHYLIHKSKNGKAAIVMEEGNGVIENIRAGIEPSVRYVEGCL